MQWWYQVPSTFLVLSGKLTQFSKSCVLSFSQQLVYTIRLYVSGMRDRPIRFKVTLKFTDKQWLFLEAPQDKISFEPVVLSL
jgi:hypothetical protein